MRPSLGEREPELPHDRGRLHAGGPADRARGHALAGRERGRALVHALEASARAQLDAARPQLPRRELREALRDLGHDLVERLHEDPARAGAAAARVLLDRVVHVVLELRDPLDARVAGADEDEGEVLAPALVVRERLGYLEVHERAVAQRDAVRERLEARGRARPGPVSAARARRSRAPPRAGRSGTSRRARRGCARRSRSRPGRRQSRDRGADQPTRAPRGSARPRGAARATPPRRPAAAACRAGSSRPRRR